MRIAVFQFASGENIIENSERIQKAIKQAAEHKVRLLVFHECASCGYPPIETPDVNKIDFDLLNQCTLEVQRQAKQNDMYISLGTIRIVDGLKYNSSLLINPQGEIMGSYDKRARWGWDLDNFAKGNSIGIYDIDGVKIGFRICFEIRFPEYFRELYKSKVELCFVSFSDVSEQDLPERYNIIRSHLITRAVENVMTIVSVNSSSKFQTCPTAVFNISGGVVKEAPKNQEHLLIYDYVAPEIGFGTNGIMQNADEVMGL